MFFFCSKAPSPCKYHLYLWFDQDDIDYQVNIRDQGERLQFLTRELDAHERPRTNNGIRIRPIFSGETNKSMIVKVNKIFGMDLIHNTERFRTHLNSIVAPNLDNIFRLNMCVHYISDSMLAQFVFRYRPSIWKPIVRGAISHFSFCLKNPEFHPKSAKSSEYQQGKLPEPCILAWTSICTTMCHWGRRQFIYAMDNGLCNLIALVSNRIFRSNPLLPMFAVAVYYGPLKFLEELDCAAHSVNKDLPIRFHKLVKSALLKHNGDTYLSKCHESEVTMYIESFYHCHGPSMTTCALPSCTKTKHDNVMYKCKRCRLVRYCCRRHQKKDWKLIHSQQCKSLCR